jgi:uncharacterized membrane protein
MKTSRTPVIFLALLYAVFFSCLALANRQLPEQVAGHFNATGQPDSWMSRPAYLQFISIFGSVVPLFIIVVFRSLPMNLINVPNRDYWFAPERRAQSRRFLFCQSFWFACLMSGFFIGVNFAVVQANTHSPARLSLTVLLGVAGFFLAGTLLWVMNLFRQFSRMN